MTFPLAQSGFSFLIYLVVGVFWLVGQVLQQKKAKQRAEELKQRRLQREQGGGSTGQPPVQESKQSSIERELEDFLGRLSGQPQSPPPPPPPPPPKPAKPIYRKQATPPPPPIQFDQRPPAALDQVPEPPAEIVAKSRIKDMRFQDSIQDIAEMKEAKEIIGELMAKGVKHEALSTVRAMKVDLTATILQMPTLPMQNIRPVNTKTQHLDLKDTRQFRKALVSSILLEPPKALQADPFKGTD